MRWIMMAAGSGTRFGPGVPKPFRLVDHETPMYTYVARANDLPLFRLVLRHEHRVDFKFAGSPASLGQVRSIPDTGAMGPAYSAVLGTLDVEDDGPICLVDCDCFVDMELGFVGARVHEVVENTRSRLGAKREWASVVTVEAPDTIPGVSVLKFPEDPRLDGSDKLLVEGGAVAGDLMNVGIYVFSSAGVLRRTVAYLQTKNYVKNSELKLSAVYNQIRDRIPIQVKGRFVNLGTPEALEAYQREPK